MTPEGAIERDIGHQRLPVGQKVRILLNVVYDSRERPPHAVGWVEEAPSGQRTVRILDTPAAQAARALLRDGMVTASFDGVRVILS